MNRHPVQQIQSNINHNNVPLKSVKFISTIMSLFLIIAIASSLLVRLRAIENKPLRLVISSPNYFPNDPKDLMNFSFNSHTTWILTCRVIPSDRFPPLNITLVNEHSTRLAHSNFSNSVTLSIINATEADSGEYKCTAQGPGHWLNAKATIRAVKGGPCPRNHFSCDGRCIFPIFLCDGFADCPSGSDEDPDIANCSINPCDKKRMCGKRCIPHDWCCTPGQDECNVPHPPSCCPHPGYRDISELRRRDDGFLETTIYIVIGCATAFLVVVFVVVMAVCRFHMKRSTVPRHQRAPVNLNGRVGMTRPPGAPGMGDFDVYLNQALIDLSQHSGLLVTYNINSGVQLMGRPVDPPPYCEVVSPPPRGGPPPPYVPRENMRLQVEESEDAVNSEDDALLRGVRDSNRPIGGNDCLPPGTDQSYTRRASQDSIPCGSDEVVPVSEITRVGISMMPSRKVKPPDSAVANPAVAVVTADTNFKQIRSSSPSADEKGSAG